LFCCAGGAARGYAAAGYQVVGVDIEPQPTYPYEFIRADALAFLAQRGQDFDAVHASPPCQGYSHGVRSTNSQYTDTKGSFEPRLIGDCRALLQRLRVPWVIENVAGARAFMNVHLILCGSMFGLHIARHRLFESNVWLQQPQHPKCSGRGKRYAARMGWDYRDMTVTGKGRNAGTSQRWKHLLGLSPAVNMTQHQLAEAIPPAYTRYIGAHLLLHALL
jgi:DNA (cytosine-5)-methyltransferase 1